MNLRKKNLPDEPLITIGMTCYNAAATIGRAIESALRQDWPNKEILIVDDASTDNSVTVIERAIANCPYARLVRHAVNKGGGGASQTVAQEAKGTFIAFFDDDDESLPARVRTQFERLTTYEKETGVAYVACYASGRRVYPNGYTVPLQAIGARPASPVGTEAADYLLFFCKKRCVFYGNGTPTCSLFMRRSILLRVGGFDERFRRSWDADLSVRLALVGTHFIGCAEELFIQYATQSSDKSAAKNLECEVALAQKYRDYLTSVHRYDYALEWPKVRYYHFTKQHGKMLMTLGQLFLHHPFAVMHHFLAVAPRRFVHEKNMSRRS